MAEVAPGRTGFSPLKWGPRALILRRLLCVFDDQKPGPVCVDSSRSWLADALERGTSSWLALFNWRLAALPNFSTGPTRISQTRAEWLFFGVDSDFALVFVAANRAAFQSSRRASPESSDDGSISARVSMALVAKCSDGGGCPGVAVKSDRFSRSLFRLSLTICTISVYFPLSGGGAGVAPAPSQRKPNRY
jgi:hypothetical protein